MRRPLTFAKRIPAHFSLTELIGMVEYRREVKTTNAKGMKMWFAILALVAVVLVVAVVKLANAKYGFETLPEWEAKLDARDMGDGMDE